MTERTGPPHPVASATPRRRRRRRPIGLGALILLVLGGAIWWYVPPILGVRDARDTAATLAARLSALGPGDLTTASVAGLRATVERLATQIAPAADLLRNDPLVGLARALGPTRDQVLAADALAAAADDLVDAARLGLDLGGQVATLREAGEGQGLIAGLVGIMADSTGTVDRVGELLASAEASLAAMPPGAAGVFRDARAVVSGPLVRYRPLLDEYRRIDDRLPALLGHDGQRRYLVLAQNPAELRPTGGFLGTYGILTLQDGRMASMEFHDVYTLDDQPGMPYQEPPEALAAYLLGRSSWELADANWSPDFPTSAADALRLYTLESHDADIDGVIAITTYALDELLAVTGPVEVPGTGVTVGPGEVTVAGIANTREVDPGGADRKRFLSLLADEVLQRLFALDASRWTDLASAALRIGDERLALAWFPDPADQAVLEGSRWTGEIRQDGTDLLAVVDANVSPSSKLSMVVERSTELAVTLGADGGADHRLRLEWRNDADRPGEPYQTLRAASESASGQYGLLTRTLVPIGSEWTEVLGDSALPVSGVEFEEEVAGRRAWGSYLLVDPGATAWLESTWITPDAVAGDGAERRYHLVLQKQPGQIAEPVRVVIAVPDGATITGTSPGMTVAGGTATWQGTLVEDQELEVRFRP